MIPPLQSLRLRSIERWLRDQTAVTDLPGRALDLDEQMMEAFEAGEDSLKESMMAAKTWGTAEGLEQFPVERLRIWNDVVGEFLPFIAEHGEPR